MDQILPNGIGTASVGLLSFAIQGLSLKGGKSLVKSNFRALTAFLITIWDYCFNHCLSSNTTNLRAWPSFSGGDRFKSQFWAIPPFFFPLPNLSNKYGGIIIYGSTKDFKQCLNLSVCSDIFWVFLLVEAFIVQQKYQCMAKQALVPRQAPFKCKIENHRVV